jgi:hypothetical protein
MLFINIRIKYLWVRQSSTALVGGVAASWIASSCWVDLNHLPIFLAIRVVSTWNKSTIYFCTCHIASIPYAAVDIEVDHATVLASGLSMRNHSINVETFCELYRPCWIVATGVGLLRARKQDYEEKRVERNAGWRWEPFVWEEIGISEGHGPEFVVSIIFFWFFFFFFFLFLCSLALRLILFSCLFPNQWGRIPRMGKTQRVRDEE